MSWSFNSGLHFMQILESKGDIGVFTHLKPQVTAPKEFHFSTDVRLGPPSASVADLFDKVAIDSHCVITIKLFSGQTSYWVLPCFAALSSLWLFFTQQQARCAQTHHTKSFQSTHRGLWKCLLSEHAWHFLSCPRNKIITHTLLQERGHLKEKQLEAQLLHKKMEEEKARLHKANPYPYTTDYPVVCENFILNNFSYSLVLIVHAV